MKTICPTCELYLVEITISYGLATYFCEKCASKAKTPANKSDPPLNLAPKKGVVGEDLENRCEPKCLDELYCFDCSGSIKFN